MDKYIRKIIHLERLKNDIFVEGNNTVAYYKFEKRKGKSKIALSIDKIKPIDNKAYILCLAYEVDKIGFIKEMKILEITDKNSINETIQLDEKLSENILGIIIIMKDNHDLDLKSQVVLVGYQNERFDLNSLNREENYLSDTRIENNTNAERSKEVEKKALEEKSTEENQEIIEQKTIEQNDVKQNNIKGNSIEENSVEQKNIDEKNIEKKSQENEGGLNKEKEAAKNNSINTIEYIKKQLEEKEELSVIDELFEKNQKMEPFAVKDPNTNWIKIDITDLVFLPIESWLLINNAFLMNNYKKYKHLILGRNEKEGILSLGIPDIYYFRDSLIANICGFDEFYTCCGGPIKSGEYGYWIIKTIL